MSADRWELIEALGAFCDTPPAASAAAQALGLGPTSGEGHTRVFVMNLLPHASIYLGGEGQLGGEATDRVTGFWRAVTMVPDADADHLSSLLALYVHLGTASETADVAPQTRRAIVRMRQALLWEHLWPWVPAYTHAVESLGDEPYAAWARLLRHALADDLAAAAASVGEQAPVALREAPEPLDPDAGVAALLDAVVAPVRSGIILTRHGLAAAAANLGVGYRLGERRFALKAMLEQDPTATVAWMAEEAARWVELHERSGSDTASTWWAERARHSARALELLATRS